ncbi:MAG: thioredoxin domain-containing protein [Thermoguttaceae bacterium]|nr:thioredoxin domain-containing protein [Thermoguttaceae bacterium]
MAAIWQTAIWCLLGTVGNDTVLLDFYADWCGPCRAMAPLVEQLARQGYPIRKINIDHHPELAARFGVRSVPCFVMVVNGREVGREIGQVSLARLLRLCQLGRQNSVTGGGTKNPAANQGFPGTTTAENLAVLPRGNTQAIAAPTPTTKAGLPIPVVELGVPREPWAQDASFDPPNQDGSANGSAGAGALAGASSRGQPNASTEQSSPPATSPSSPPVAGIEQELVAATVRLRVYHGNSLSHGTGTIIDTRQGEALILTCGHLFRESQGRGQIEVDLFGPTPAEKISGRLIAWNDQRDLGLLSIKIPGPVRAARVAPVGYPVKKGLLVFSVGCDHGQPPTVRKTWIVSVNRYLGWPNLQVADQPVSGRSGGGLFTQEGYLIGVCNAADPTDREGLFSSLPAIHAQLDEVGLQFVYQQPPDVTPQMPRPSPSALADNSSPCPLPSFPSGWPRAGNPAFDGDQPSGPALAGLKEPSGRPTNQLGPSANPVPGNRSGPIGSEANEPISDGGRPIRPTAVGSSAQLGPPPAERVNPWLELASWIQKGSIPANSAGGSPGGTNPSELAHQQVPSDAQPRTSPATPPGEPHQPTSSTEAGSVSSREMEPDRLALGGGLRPEESALLAELARRRRQGAEVIFIVRPTDDPHAKSEIFVLQDASPELLAQLGAAGQPTKIRETSLVVGTGPKRNGSLASAVPEPPPQPPTRALQSQ